VAYAIDMEVNKGLLAFFAEEEVAVVVILAVMTLALLKIR